MAFVQVLPKLQELYKQSVDMNKNFDELVRGYVTALVKDGDALHQVPLLDATYLDYYPNNTLVRYRGMVQDIFNPEYYIDSYRNPGGPWQTTRYSDSAANPIHESAQTNIGERKPLYCVPVPGEPHWVQEPARNHAALLAEHTAGTERSKRGRACESAREDAFTEAQNMAVDEPLEVEGTKQPRVQDDRHQVAAAAANGTAANGTATNGATGGHSGTQHSTAGDCIVYVYGSGEGDVKLNDVVDVLGLVSHAPELAAAHFECDGDGSMEEASYGFAEQEAAARPPTSKVPRVHALLVTRPADGILFPSQLPIPLEGAQTSSVRNSIVELFSGILGGDKLAAEYLLLTIISRAHHRCDGSPVGLLSLNLFDAHMTLKPGVTSAQHDAAPSDLGHALYIALQALLPKTTTMALNVEHLNAAPLTPHRDYTSNRVVSTPLQLSDGTVVLLDETHMTAGQLNETGVGNIKALQTLLTHHEVQYDFKYYTLSMSADVPLVVLSKGKSILKDCVDVVLPVRACVSLGGVDAVKTGLEALSLPIMRGYLQATQSCDFKLEGDVGAKIEADIVAVRQKDPSLTADHFHQLLTLARLLCVSYGETTLGEERWQAVRTMEHKRNERLRVA